MGIAVDQSRGGALLIAEAGNSRIRIVSPDGMLGTFAGSGSYFGGFRGDGGPATSALLNEPTGVYIDPVTLVTIICDRGNKRVRAVAPSGVISTLAGNGSFGLTDDVAPATSALLVYPSAAASDGSGLLIADSRSHRVRKLWPSGSLTTVAGNGFNGFSGDGGGGSSAQLDWPAGIAVDAVRGVAFICDQFNHRVRRLWLGNGTITTVAGFTRFGFRGDGGPARAAVLYSPQGVAVDPTGGVIIADTLNRRIRKVWPSGIITTVAGDGRIGFAGDGGPATAARLTDPRGVAVTPGGEIFVADTGNKRVRRVQLNGVITTFAGSESTSFGLGGPAIDAGLVTPTGVAFDVLTSSVIIADRGIARATG